MRSAAWEGLPPKKFFSSLLLRAAINVYYAHPAAWNEIGFGGPAYPRGYANLGIDKLEHWERPEREPIDPIPWAKRAEAVKKAHAERRQAPAR